jgi:hypothetical protein
MQIQRLLAFLDELLAYVEREADREQQLGPTWLADLSAAGLDALRQLKTSITKGRLPTDSRFDVAVLLGQSWVEVHPKVDRLVAAINQEIRQP